MTAFLVYDVFAEAPFGGNPLAVIPDATGLPEDALMKIAREFNFSETSFVYPPNSPSHTARVRIFTPVQEIPFAGHPTVGTAVALAELGRGTRQVLELGVGPLSCTVEGRHGQFTTEAPFEVLADPVPADVVARCLGLPAGAVKPAPVQASLGLPFVLAELADRAALAAASPDATAFAEGARRYPAGNHFAILAWVDDGEVIHARMFAPFDTVIEDPATGSAAATLGSMLQARRGTPQALTIHQGFDMGRPSRISVTAEPGRVTVAGTAVRVMEGRLTL